MIERTGRMVAILAGLAFASTAAAQDIDGRVSFAYGAQTSFDDRNEEMRFDFDVEVTPYQGRILSVGVAVPFSVWGSDDNWQFGIDDERLVFELAPTARVRFLPESLVRPYVDVGVGFAHTFNQQPDFLDDVEVTNGENFYLVRGAAGLEIGGHESGSFFAIINPVILNTYGDGDDVDFRYAGSVGVGINI